MERELAAMSTALSIADSLAKDAENARWYAERQRDKADEVLHELGKAYPELKQRAVEIEKEKNEALMNLVEARRQEQAKQVALEGERTARVDETAQRRIAEARADSIATEKRRSDNLRVQQRASVLAQNSMTVIGRPEFRGLMAVYALRSMEQAGGDGNKDELVQALRAAVGELERTSPVRVSGFKRALHQLTPEKNPSAVLAIGHDARLHRVDMSVLGSSVVADHSRFLEPGTGRSFLASDRSAMILTDQQLGIAAYSITRNSLIAKSSSATGSEAIRSATSWPDLTVVVTGDAQGNVQPWRREGGGFKPMEQRNMGAAIKGMAYDATTGQVVIVAAKGPAWLMSQDGAIAELPLPSGQNGYCMASTGSGIAYIGTDRGSVLRMDLKASRVSAFTEGGGPRVEVIAAAPSGSRIAYVNAVKELVVLDTSPTESKVRMVLDAIPTAMVLGENDELYLASGDRIERVLCTSRSMANRICDLVGRTWTPEEWKELGETGAPEPTCAGF